MKVLKWFCFFLIITACNEKQAESIPPEIMSRDSMIDVLADIHIAEARILQSGPQFRDKIVRSVYLKQVLSKASVDTSRFLSSFEYYSANPELFAGMYEQVVVEISKRQAEKSK